MKLISNFAFSNYPAIEEITSPVIVIHGTSDEVIPFSSGKKLFEHASSSREKVFISIKDGRHKNLANFDDFQESLEELL